MPNLSSFTNKKKRADVDLDLEQFGYLSEDASNISSNKIVAYTSYSEELSISTNFVGVVDMVMSTFILAFIYFCIALEELEWILSSSKEENSVRIIDDSAWNIYKLFPRLLHRGRA